MKIICPFCNKDELESIRPEIVEGNIFSSCAVCGTYAYI